MDRNSDLLTGSVGNGDDDDQSNGHSRVTDNDNDSGNNKDNDSSSSEETSTSTKHRATQTTTSVTKDLNAHSTTSSESDTSSTTSSRAKHTTSSSDKDKEKSSTSTKTLTSSEESLKLKSTAAASESSEGSTAQTSRIVTASRSSSISLSGSLVLPAALTSTSARTDKNDDNSTVGTIAGIATVGVICIFALVGFILWKKRQRARRTVRNSSNDSNDGDLYGSIQEIKSGHEKPPSMMMHDFPESSPMAPPRSVDPFETSFNSYSEPASPWMYPAVGLPHSANASVSSFAPDPVQPAGRGSVVSSHSQSLIPRSPSPALHPAYKQDMPQHQRQLSEQTAQPSVDDQQNAPEEDWRSHVQVQSGHIITQPTPFRPMSTDWVTGGNEIAQAVYPVGRPRSPSEATEANTIRVPRDSQMVRDSRYTSGFSTSASDHRISTSAFPVPPPAKQIESLPGLPDHSEHSLPYQHRRSTSFGEPIPRSLTPGGAPLHNPHHSTFVARPVSHASDTTTFETATTNFHNAIPAAAAEPSQALGEANSRFFLLPPRQIPSNSTGHNEEHESSESLDLHPPTRPFAASPIQIETAPQTGASISRSGSPLTQPHSPLRYNGDDEPTRGARSRSGTLTKNPFVLDNEGDSSDLRGTGAGNEPRDSFDITGNYYYERDEPQSENERPESAEILAPMPPAGEQPREVQPRQRTNSESSLSAPARVSGSDWGFLSDLLQETAPQSKSSTA